jgi:ubiquinol-cytochrome c reductase cytochrome b subunit
LFFLGLFFWPFIDRNPARHPTARPVALAAGGVFLLVVFGFRRHTAGPRLAPPSFPDPQAVSPGSFMPKFPLTDQQLGDLTGYMLSLKKSP